MCASDAECDNAVCTCKAGFTGDGHTCTPVDDCNNTCSPNADCVDEDGDGVSNCKCNSHYTGDGTTCEEIHVHENTCDGAHVCSTNGKCVHRGSGAFCECLHGFTGDGVDCDPIQFDLCHNQCDDHAECDFQGVCVCKPGYNGNGYSCAQDAEPATTEAVTTEAPTTEPA